MNVAILQKSAQVLRTGQALRLGLQFLLLAGVSQLADHAVCALQLPVPSNAVGMLVLFLLLHYRVLRLEHVNSAAALLVPHLAFFFIPIAVGFMAYRELLATTGLALLAVIAASAVAGMLVAGVVAQQIKRAQS